MAKACPKVVYETQYRDTMPDPLAGMQWEEVNGQRRLVVPRDKTRFQRAKLILV